jgi:hypothetical protein
MGGFLVPKEVLEEIFCQVQVAQLEEVLEVMQREIIPAVQEQGLAAEFLIMEE